MFKINRRGAIWLMLLGAMVGSMAVTGTSASAMSKKAAAAYKEAVAKENKASDELSNLGMRNINDLTRDSESRTDPGELQPDVFTVYSRLTLSNENRHKQVTINKKSVVQGEIDSRHMATVMTPTLSQKNRNKVLNKIGKDWWFSVSKDPLSSATQASFKPHQPKTAFAYGAYMNLPELYKYNNKTKVAIKGNKFITVTADNYLSYYTNRKDYTQPAQSVKIKKFVRGKSVYSYYLAKPLKGFGTKKVRVGKATRYLLKMSLGHIFQASDADATDGYKIIVNVGNQKFYVGLGNMADSFIYQTMDEDYGEDSFDEQKAKEYIQSLQ